VNTIKGIVEQNYPRRGNADDLKTCMDDAKKGYELCLEECETEAKSTEAGIDGNDDRCIQKVERATII